MSLINGIILSYNSLRWQPSRFGTISHNKRDNNSVTVFCNRNIIWYYIVWAIEFGSSCGWNCDIQWYTWWRHQMETISALLALSEENPRVTGGFPLQRPVTRSFHVFCDLHRNKRLSKQSRHGYLRRHRAHYDITVMENWDSTWYQLCRHWWYHSLS